MNSRLCKRPVGLLSFSAGLLLMVSSCHQSPPPTPDPGTNPDTTVTNYFKATYLVASNGNYADARVDATLINPWGFDFSPFGPAFISSNGSGTSVIYSTPGEQRRTPTQIPGPGDVSGGKPTGVVFNTTNKFFLADFAPARFIYAGADGVVSAWNADYNAQLLIDNSATASYTGIAIANNASMNYIYLANFKEGRIDVYDETYTAAPMDFTDPQLPAGYSPYNIRNIDGKLYVTYAKRGASGEVETGAGKGFVNIFNPDGNLVQQYVSAGKLDAPWGITRSKSTFWAFSGNQPNSILIANSGDGKINAYSESGAYLQTIQGKAGPLTITGLKQISFAADSLVADRGKLFFTAGANTSQGVFGFVQQVQ